MSNGGSISSMNSTLKNNRKNLRSKRKGFKDTFDGKTSTSKKFVDKKVSKEELTKIKNQIIKKSKNERQMRTLIFLVVIITITIVGLLIV